MALTGSDLGQLADLAQALGLLDSGGNLNGDWLNAPGDRLKNVLADDHQREALVRFVDEALSGSEEVTDATGLVWLPVFERGEAGHPAVTVFVVLDDAPADHVAIGIGVTVAAADAVASVKAHVPLFRATKLNHAPAADPVVLGTADGVVSIDAQITIADPTIQSASLTAVVPTGGSVAPMFGLALEGLLLPDAPAPRDVDLSLTDFEELESTLLELVLGLVKTQVDAAGAGPLSSLAGLVGLRDGGAVPALPVHDVLEHGVTALAAWFEGVIGGDATRAVWLAELADLLGGAVAGDAVELTLGPARLSVGARAGTGSGGHATVTPFVAVEVGPANGDVVASATVDLALIDLGSGSATALPSCSVGATLGRRTSGAGTPLLTGDPAVDRFVFGFALDGDRKPTLRLAAEHVTIGGHLHEVVDLSSPGAVAQAAGTVVGDVLDSLLGELGAVADAARVLFGLAPPSGFPAVPTIDPARFLQDPLGAVADYWHTLLDQHADAVPAVLAVLRDLVADAAKAGLPVSGTGTSDDPWRTPIVGPVELQAWTAGSVMTTAVGARFIVDDLGQRCTRLQSDVAVGVVAVDFGARHASFLPLVTATLAARARGSTTAELDVGRLALAADRVGVEARWQPGHGLAVGLVAPNLVVHLPEQDVPIPLPTIAADGTVTLSAAEWDALEGLLGALAAAAPVGLAGDLARALGWRLRAPGEAPSGPHLRLADVATDAAHALEQWLGELALEEADELLRLLRPLARALTGSGGDWGALTGTGTPGDPWLLGREPAATVPALAAWIEPDGPSRGPIELPSGIATWTPSLPPPPFELLAAAARAAAVDDVVLAGLVAGRDDLAAGLDALLVRFEGSDGVVVPPPTAPDGVIVQTFDEVLRDELAGALDLEALLGRAPATTVRVSVGDDAWSDEAPADRVVRLDTPGLAPEAFPLPTGATGDWFVVLAGRAAAKLASGDPDGVAGQAERLQRVLAALGAADDAIAVVATAEAGHAAVRAADAVATVTDVVTLGTPWSPVSLSVIDVAPAAEAVRFLAALVPSPAEEDVERGTDLARGRSLLAPLVAAIPEDDPVRELRPPASAPGPFRAGLGVHALYGVASADLVRRALTALVVEGLGSRVEAAAVAEPESLRTGVRLPFAEAAPTGLGISGHATIELAGVERGAEDAIGIAADRAVHVHVELARAGGWLVGGPDPARAPGSRHDVDLRRLEADLTVPVSGPHDRASATLVLHEARVFGLSRPRWVVRATGAALAADEATPALPEVRVLLSALAEALTAARAADPTLATALDALQALGLLGGTGGSVPDAVDHLLHDPVAFSATVMADAARRAALLAALGPIVGGTGTGDVLTWQTGPASVTLDLAARQATVDVAGSGAVPWTIHGTAGVGRPDLAVVFGSAGSGPAGGARVTLATSPALAVAAEWHPPGAAPPETVRLWPSPDEPALLRLLTRLVPAELARIALEYLRRLDDDARPIVDAALDAGGLLATAPAADGLRPVRLPLALVTDPLGWFAHAGALGAAGGGLDPTKGIALLDALKPIVGLTGAPGEWDLASGVTIRADAHDGHLRIAIELDTSGLAPIGAADERLVASLLASLTLPPGSVPQPGVELAVGLPGAAPGRRSAHVVLDGGVQVFVRPDSGADIPLYPNPPGLGQLAGAVKKALPLVLNALSDETGNDLKGKAGAVVRAVGDELGLRTGAPPEFHEAELDAWAADPAGSLAARLPTLAAGALNTIAAAVGPALPTGLAAGVAGNKLQVTLGSTTLGVTASPFAVTFVAEPSNIPGLGRVRIETTASAGGLAVFDVTAGPAAVDAGGAVLRPYFRARVGASPPGGRRAELGLALDDAGTKAVSARWLLGGSFGLVAVDGAAEQTDPAAVALAAVEAVVDLAGSVVVATDAARDVLGRPCGAATVGDVLEGVVVHKQGTDWELVPGLFDTTQVLGRLQRIALNLVRVAQPKLDLAELSLALVESPADVLGVELIPKDRYPLGGSDVTFSLEFDASWIEKTPAPQPALLLRLLRVGADPTKLTFEPGIEVDGIGIRVERTSGPLLELASITLASVGVHLYGEVGGGAGIAGGVQLQLTDLAVGAAGAGGGNQVAQGVLKDAGSGETKLAPKFSPTVAVQKQPAAETLVTLRAGDPPGPWWLAIQKGFGPVYIEQVGFDAKVEQRHLQSISLLLDGRVSLFGLTAAVDDLSLTFIVASNASVFDPSRWAVDLAGFAIASDLGGIELVGGLRKFSEPGPPGQPDTVQYIGMLLGRFDVYGLSVFGGYGLGRSASGETFASFFAFGAVNGPIGGPPAFFLTGIGGGVGINRDLVFPQDLSQFGTFPFIQALDPGATPPSDPMAVLAQYKDTFPVRQGQFWFAAGISFNSFALVDGVAVVAVSVGDGLELTLLGLGRMALPRPQFALVSIEIGLVCRFSSSEGVLWIQAQLTDNSWLLFPDIRLTGGFAFVTWFKGPNRGQFVLTLGGYHPSFHRDGYPVVPRLGFTVDLLGAITLKGETYFALTSEALMAGGRVEGSAELGPAWAHVVFGADGIVFFDPFWLDVRVYAHISAGATIDVWIGEITISVSTGGQIHVTGPSYHGEVEFDVGPLSLTFEFGDSSSEPVYIDYPTFVGKYLEEAPDGSASALSAITGRGSLIPKPGPGGAKDVATPDGSAAKPFVVISEFECLVTTTVPIVEVRADGAPSARADPSEALGIAPMGLPRMEPALRLRLFDSSGHDHLPDLLNEPDRPRLTEELRDTGSFPVAVWGLPQNKDAKKVPSGDVILAVEGARLDFHAKIEPGLPPVAYDQVETDKRRPLPFVGAAERAALMADAASLAALVPGGDVDEVASHVLARAGNSETAIAALPLDRAAPPRLGSLTEGLVTAGAALADFVPPEQTPPPTFDHRVYPPRAVALMTAELALPERLVRGTNVGDAPDAPRRPAPTLASVQATTDVAVAARLRRVAAPALVSNATVVANGAVPLTRAGRAPSAAVRGRGAMLDGQQRLDALGSSLTGSGGDGSLAAGEVAVLELPNARRDAAAGDRPALAVDGPARVVVLAHAGTVLADDLRPARVTIPSGSERIAVLALGDSEEATGGGLLAGWHAGQQLAGVGWNCALGSRCLVRTEGATVAPQRQRRDAGWVKGAELVRGTTTVTTTLLDGPRAVAVVLDQPVGAANGEGLAMTLGDATRIPGPDGRPLPPTVVASGVRSAVVYAIEPGDGPVTVTVASEDGWHLAGVVGGTDVASVSDTLAERGLDAALRPLAAGGGRVTLSWSEVNA